jgi:ferredoxin
MPSIFRHSLSSVGPVATRRLQQIPTRRGLATTTSAAAAPVNVLRRFSSTTTGSDGGVIAKQTTKITYIDPSGEEHSVDAELGKNMMEVAHKNNIELEGNSPRLMHPFTFIFSVAHARLLLSPATDEGACGGELACSTCHLVFEKEVYDTLPPKTDEEEDMLDLAFELTET